MTRDGLSRRITEEAFQNLASKVASPNFIIKGPMGKGLDLKTSGVHIALTAGTGVLPFLDLVACLIRLNLGIDPVVNLAEENSQETVPNKDDFKYFQDSFNLSNFKLVLYVSFNSPEEAIGRELCKGLAKIMKIMKRDNFEYYERFSVATMQQ